MLLAAARYLSMEENAEFLVFWALMFGTFGVLSGIHTEATRASFHASTADARSPRVVVTSTTLGGAVAGLLLLSSPLWAEALLGRDGTWLVGCVACAGLAFSAQTAISGALAGAGRWRAVAVLTALESLLRLLLVAAVVLASGSVRALAAASASATAGWLLVLGRRSVRTALHARGAGTWVAQAWNLLRACAASTSSAALLVGFPILIRVTSTDAEFQSAAPLILAVVLTRAPLLLPLNAYQGVLLAHFLQHRALRGRALVPAAWILLPAALIGAASAFIFGPWLFHVLLGADYTISRSTLAALTLAAGSVAALTITGACCMAVAGPGPLAAGWMIATLGALLLLMTPLDLHFRVTVSLLLAPLLGVAWHWHAIRRIPCDDPTVTSS